MNNKLISVIVTTKNSENTIEACLLSIQNQTYKNIEIILIDNNSIDKTKIIAKKYADKVLNKGPERSSQRNYGGRISKGEHILIIDSDMELSNDLVKGCVDKLTENSNNLALIIPEESFGKSYWARCKKLEKSFYCGVDWMEAARYFKKDIFLEIKGYNEDLYGGEDYDLTQRVIVEYGDNSICAINNLIYHNENQITLIRSCKKKFYYAKELEKYKTIKTNTANFYIQSSIIKRFKLFFSDPGKLFKNPITGLGMLFMKVCEFCIGGLGYFISKKDNKATIIKVD